MVLSRERVDIWTFGCVLFEMLAGQRAFAGEDVTECADRDERFTLEVARVLG